jgi:hypothetical protein
MMLVLAAELSSTGDTIVDEGMATSRRWSSIGYWEGYKLTKGNHYRCRGHTQHCRQVARLMSVSLKP